MSQGYTTIKYGNVTLLRVITKHYTQEPVMDASGTDLRFMKHTISVSGYLTGNMAGTVSLGGGSPSSSFVYDLTKDNTGIDPQGYANVRHLQIRRQLPPRQTFTMLVGDLAGDGSGGAVLLTVSPAPLNMIPRILGQNPTAGTVNLSKIDLNNGPNCTSFVVTRIVANESYEIEATFELHVVECDRFGNVPNNNSGILNNRWSCEDSYDANMRTTRSYNGELLLASNNLSQQQYRWIVVPPLMPMFRRDGLNFTASEDGLSLRWSCTDTEIFQSAPYPCRRWEVSQKVSAPNAMFGQSSMRIQVWGDMTTDKTDLIEVALYALTAKMFSCAPQDLNKIVNGRTAAYWNQFVVEDLEFEDPSTDDNSIIISIRMRKTIDAINGLAAVISDISTKFGAPFGPNDFRTTAYTRDNRPAYDRGLTWGAFTGDTPPYQSPAASIIGIFATYLQTPCNDQHATYLKGSDSSISTTVGNRISDDLNGKPYSPDPIPYQATIVASLAPADAPNPYISDSQKQAPYIQWQIDNLYKTRTTRVQMPIAVDNLRSIGAATVTNPGISPSSAVVKLSGFQAIRIVRVSAMRSGAECEFPNPDDVLKMPPFPNPPGTGSIGQPPPQALTQTFLSQKIRTGTPTVTPFGQKIYRAEAQYIFGLSRAPNPDEKLAIGNNKWSVDGNQDSSPLNEMTNSTWVDPPAN